MSHVQAARDLIGRDEELGTVAGFLDAIDELPGAIVLQGTAGIGKTALWLAGVDAANSRGYRLLSSRPSEAETGFSFAGLADLLGPAADDVLPELPAIQRRALEAALLLGESNVGADDRAVATAFLGALRLLAADGPLCLAVDDVQWLDRPRSRPSVTRSRVSTTRRSRSCWQSGARCRPGFAAPPSRRRCERSTSSASVGATHQLLRSRLDATFSRPILLRLWETSQGNPLLRARARSALQGRGGTLAPGEELPIPSDLDALLHARLDGLSPAALEVARVVGALAEPTTSLVETAVGSSFETGLAETLAARILELDGERLRFTHPLLGSAVAARVTPSRRRELHARLAEIARTAEEYARHLALAAVEPNDEIAAILEHEAGKARARGASAAAVELAEQAVRLTPTTRADDARRRILVAAELQRRAGDSDRAAVLLERERVAAAPGNERAKVLTHLAGVQANPQDAVALYREALEEAEADDALQADIQLRLAGLMRLRRRLRARDRAQQACRPRRRAGRRRRAPLPRSRRLRPHAVPGRTRHTGAEMEGARARASVARWPLDNGPTMVFGHQLWWSADVDRARELFDEVRAVATARNDPVRLTGALWHLGFLGGEPETGTRRNGTRPIPWSSRRSSAISCRPRSSRLP